MQLVYLQAVDLYLSLDDAVQKSQMVQACLHVPTRSQGGKFPKLLHATAIFEDKIASL